MGIGNVEAGEDCGQLPLRFHVVQSEQSVIIGSALQPRCQMDAYYDDDAIMTAVYFGATEGGMPAGDAGRCTGGVHLLRARRGDEGITRRKAAGGLLEAAEKNGELLI